MTQQQFRDADEGYFVSRRKKAITILSELQEEGVSPKKKLKVLEVGCNHGFIAYHLASMTSWSISAGDLNKENLFKYAWIKEKVDVALLDATKMKFKDGSFDLVIYNHVIEHIPEWEKTIREIYRVLKKGGVLYLATPNLHRLLVGPKVLLAKKDGLDRAKRIDNHMGFSVGELRALLAPFTHIKSLNKRHFVNNVAGPARPLLRLLPQAFHEKYAQTNVFIVRK